MPSPGLPADAIGGDTARAPITPDEIARAEAHAQAARARATRLRQQAEMTLADRSGGSGAEHDADPGEAGITLAGRENESAPSRRMVRRPGRRTVAVAIAIMVSSALLTGCGFLLWMHRSAVQQKQRSAEFAAAARNAVTTMMSLDPSKAREQLQHFADDTTGMFKAGILIDADDTIEGLKQSQVSSKGVVQAAAVESMTDDSAVVLVAANAKFTKAGQAEPELRSLRLVVSVQRDGRQLKVSRIEFVP
jgi:Mce-associated membrane protein